MPVIDEFSQRLEAAMKQQKAQRAVAAPLKLSPTPAESVASNGLPAGASSDGFSERLAAERNRLNPARNDVSETNGSPESEAAAEHTGPIGTGDYVVKQGDCIASIAERHGHFWQKIWDDPANAELRNVRKDPYVLYPGDRVTIPEKTQKTETGATEMRHRFRIKGRPERFRVRVLRDGEPRGNEKYELDVDGERHAGVTDADGHLACAIKPDARRALLLVGEGENQQEFRFVLGGIDPISEISGVQQRLRNLGYDCGEVDGKLGPETEAAIRAFQKKRGLQETGQADQATRDRLKTDYGC